MLRVTSCPGSSQNVVLEREHVARFRAKLSARPLGQDNPVRRIADAASIAVTSEYGISRLPIRSVFAR